MSDPLDSLFQAARRHQPDTSRAQLAFEIRLRARLRETQVESRLLTRIVWRSSAGFAAFAVVAGLWFAFAPSQGIDESVALADLDPAYELLSILN